MKDGDVKARLVYLVGASGSGKDWLMTYARGSLAGETHIAFAHRYITRAADAGAENHVALTLEEFEARQRAGLFAMHWKSHGYAYGIGIEINQWLAKGLTVVVNGSREYLGVAAQRYQELLPVWIEVPPELLRRRLQARGRESAEEIEARLARLPAGQPPARSGEIIRNDREPEAAGQALVELIRRHSGNMLCA
ncbi:phosphonate metabolism protein/1,5-bisphosphokinase (PRPP-forming) PhnN [Ramlibacter sp.]